MYDWPEIRKQTDTFWARFVNQLHSAGVSAPARLEREDTHLHWHSDELFLSQTCIFPLATELPSTTVVLGTPIYDVPYCKDGNYASVILTRKSDKRASLEAMKRTTLAYNGANSQSGFNALRNHLLDENIVTSEKPHFFSKALCTGSHRNSASAVADGAADLCSIDPVTWALIQEHDQPVAFKLKALGITGFTPALPLICHGNTIPTQCNEVEWRELVQNAFTNALQANDLPELHLSGIVDRSKTDYMGLAISDLEIFNYSIPL